MSKSVREQVEEALDVHATVRNHFHQTGETRRLEASECSVTKLFVTYARLFASAEERKARAGR